MHYYRARWYDGNLGRFISEDPIGLAGGDVNLYGYVKNSPTNLKDPTGKLAIVPIIIVGGLVAYELGLHYVLAERADGLKFNGGDAKGRKRHCYVNCMSVRLHFGNSAPVTVLGIGKEIHNVIYTGDVDDSVGDMSANFYGQNRAYIIWRSCKDLCEDCQF